MLGLNVIIAAKLGLTLGIARGEALTVSAGGYRLPYAVEGQGTPMLVLGSSIYYPRTLAPGLRAQFRIYSLTMPWFMPSSRTQGGMTRNSIVSLIESARIRLGLRRFVLVGHSIHGAVAFEYARRFPQHVRRLVLISAPTKGAAQVDRIAAKAWAGASRERHELVERNWKGLDLKRIKPELQPIAAYLAITPEAYYNPRYDARWLWKGVVVNPRLFEELFQRAFKDYEMFGDKKVVPVPTLAAVGRYDYIYPCSMWTNLGATPGLTVRVFEHSGHSPMVEESGEFERVLEAWLSR